MKKGNILLVFIMLVALSVIVGSFIFFVSGGLRSTTNALNYMRSLYIAEAGTNKAIWYLLTPVGEGGQGKSWRPSGYTKSYGGGEYSFSIVDTADPLLLILVSTGEIGSIERGVKINIIASSLPKAFDYAMFSASNLTMKGATTIYGDVYADGNMAIENPAEVLDGEVTVSEDGTISGDGTYTAGETPDDPPEMPVLDRSGYEADITFAGSGDPVVLEGNQKFKNYDLGGNTIYVNGDVTIDKELSGGGKIVCTGDMEFSGANVSSATNFTSAGEMQMKGTTNIANDSLMYSSTSIVTSGTSRLGSIFFAPGMDFGGTVTIYGLVYAWDTGAVITGTVDIYGSISNFSEVTYTGNIALYHDPQYLPDVPPPGMEAGDYDLVEGSWREL